MKVQAASAAVKREPDPLGSGIFLRCMIRQCRWFMIRRRPAVFAGSVNAQPGDSCGENLTDQHSPEICFQSDDRNSQINKQNPDGGSAQVNQESSGCSAETVQYASQCAPQENKGADPGQGFQVNTGQCIMKQMNADPVAAQQEAQGADQSQDHAAFHSSADRFADQIVSSKSTGVGNCGKQHDRQGIADNSRKHDGGKNHTGKNAVDTQSIGIGISEGAE